MNTLGLIWEDVVSLDNLNLAYLKAKKGKPRYRSVIEISKNPDKYLKELQNLLKSGTFRTSKYQVSTIICGGKERVLHKLPFFPDRVAHHALVNLTGEFWNRTMIRDTFQSIKGRGTSDCFRRVRKAVQIDKPKYALKIDINKYYPSLKNDVTLSPNLYKLRDTKALDFLFEIIESLEFLPLGNHPSQFIGNLVLNKLDCHCKQNLKIRYYFRYCDDIVIMSDSIEDLLNWRGEIQGMLNELNLEIKDSIDVINLETNYLDFVGIRFNHNQIRLRKKIERNFKESVKARNLPSLPSYYGWCKMAGAINLYETQTSTLG